ncbi:Silicon efflux transporter LSI2 [Camellia lanceoleosa]|nr:Silicon efflux transporter LSI2 [Camellia lanceoleosa]
MSFGIVFFKPSLTLTCTSKLVLGSFSFAVFWVLAIFPAVPFLSIGRTAGSLLRATLMVIFKALTPNQAFVAIDLPILGLLCSTKVVSVYLEQADMFKFLGKVLSWKSQGPKDLLYHICLVSAISSSLFTNDMTCVVLIEFMLKIRKQNNGKSHPFLLALASIANISSAATPIGNPQNLLIAIRGNMSFGEFVSTILPAMFVGVVVSVLMLLGMYWKVLCVKKGEEEVVIFEEEMTSHRFSPATMSHSVSLTNVFNSNESMMMVENLEETNPVIVQQAMEVKKEEEEEEGLGKEKGDWKRMLRKSSVYVVTNGMLIAFLLSLNMSWIALTAAFVLVVLDFKDARPSLEKVSYPLLIFFCGMFIMMDGFNRT